MESLNGKVAVVTGGASGIGRALSLAFAREGARVVVADLDDAGMAETVADVARAGGAAIAVRTDVSRLRAGPGARRPRVRRDGRRARAVQQRGRRPLRRARVRPPTGDWEWVIGVNLWGVIHGVRGVRPADDRPGEPGHIVNTASMAGLIASQGLGVYNTTKYAVVGLSETLAKGPARLWDRRVRPLPHGGQDGDPPERAEPTRTACAMPAPRTAGARSN